MFTKNLIASMALCAATGTASATTVDSFNLNVTSAAGTTSAAILASGISYIISVTGTFLIAPGRFADAEFFDFQTGTPVDGRPGRADTGVGINGADVAFGAYNAAHTYSTTFLGTGSAINVFFSDSDYSDNSGSLAVTIATADVSPVPLPASLPLLFAAFGGLTLLRRRKA